jgi:DNA polymerase III delta subunit
MVTLLHGNNTLASRRYLLDFKTKFNGEVEEVDGRRLTEKDLNEALSSLPMFFAKKLLVIQHAPRENILKKLNNSPKEAEVIIWAEKRLNLKLNQIKVLEFKETSELTSFKLAEAAANKNVKAALETLERLLSEKCPPELIVGALHREIRLLILAQEGSLAAPLPSFVVKKIEKRSSNWEVNRLKEVLEDLLNLDERVKTGKTDFRLGMIMWLLNLEKG